MQIRPEPEIIETRLRETAPALPPELRQRVLRQCREQAITRPRLLWKRQWRLAGALAGVVLFCWIGSGTLDAQNRALIARGESGQATTLQTNRADSSDYRVALRWRLQQMALLLQDRHSG